MKKLFILLLAAMAFVACNDESEEGWTDIGELIAEGSFDVINLLIEDFDIASVDGEQLTKELQKSGFSPIESYTQLKDGKWVTPTPMDGCYVPSVYLFDGNGQGWEYTSWETNVSHRPHAWHRDPMTWKFDADGLLSITKSFKQRIDYVAKDGAVTEGEIEEITTTTTFKLIYYKTPYLVLELDDTRYLLGLEEKKRGDWESYCSDYDEGLVVLYCYE